ncbi:MAG: PDZ domain-containing protein [Deltaproteobacteria bacterium]
MAVREGFPVMVVKHSLLAAAWVVLAGLPAIGDEPAHGDAAAAVGRSRDPASVRAERRQAAGALVLQLASLRYEIREEATKKIEQLGIDAIEPLLAAAAGENLEVTCRAIRALGAIYESEDDATYDAAEAALEQLADSPNRSAAQRAAAVLSPQELFLTPEADKRRLRRWKRAIVRIRELGGIVNAVDPATGQTREIADHFLDESPQLMVVLEQGWKGGGAGLVNLKRMTVRFPWPIVYVTDGVNVPAEAIENLQRAVPQLRIEGRGKAMLGVSCGPERPCRVGRVQPNSAAEKAGIEVGDVILKYDGEALENFERLIEITRSHKPGDKIELEVRRGEETIRLEARLTGWALEKPAETKK